MNTDLPDRLQALRDRSGLTYEDIARIAGLTTMQVHSIVRGTNDNPKIKTLAKVVEAMGGTLAEMLAED